MFLCLWPLMIAFRADPNVLPREFQAIIVPLPSSQDILYCLDSQYCIRDLALLLFHTLSAVLSSAFSPKIRSIPEQLAKEYSRSTVCSAKGRLFNHQSCGHDYMRAMKRGLSYLWTSLVCIFSADPLSKGIPPVESIPSSASPPAQRATPETHRCVLTTKGP